MSWKFVIHSPGWMTWVSTIVLIILVGIPIMIYRWAMSKKSYLLGEPSGTYSYKPRRILPFLDSIELKLKNGTKIGTLSRSLSYILELEKGFVFKDGGRMKKIMEKRQVIIVNEGNSQEYVFKLESGRK